MIERRWTGDNNNSNSNNNNSSSNKKRAGWIDSNALATASNPVERMKPARAFFYRGLSRFFFRSLFLSFAHRFRRRFRFYRVYLLVAFFFSVPGDFLRAPHLVVADANSSLPDSFRISIDFVSFDPVLGWVWPDQKPGKTR